MIPRSRGEQANADNCPAAALTSPRCAHSVGLIPDERDGLGWGYDIEFFSQTQREPADRALFAQRAGRARGRPRLSLVNQPSEPSSRLCKW